MLEEIKGISVKELLKDKITKINGSNKSKAKTSIIAKLKNFYQNKRLEYATNKIQELNELNQQQMTEKNDKIFEAASIPGNVEGINSVASEYESKIEKTNEKINKYTDIAEAAQSKLNEYQEVEEKNQEELINEKLKESEKKLKIEVNNMEPIQQPTVETVQPVQPEQPKKNEFEVQMDTIAEEIMKIVKPTVSKMMQDQITEYDAKSKEIINNIITGKDATIRDREAKINSLQQENNSLVADRDQYKSHLEQANNMISNKDKEIEGKNQTINSLNETLATNKKALDAKDQEIESLRAMLQKYKTSVLDIVNNIDTTNNTMEQEQSKSL